MSIPSDPLEREAEATAARVMRTPATARSSREPSSSNLRRAPAQRAPASIRNRGGGGSPLPDAVRADYEGRFGHDFSGVRIHHGAQAASLSRTYQARAFTVGSDIYFNQGEFNPSSTSGRHLLAHELTHVTQQGGETSGLSRAGTGHPTVMRWSGHEHRAFGNLAAIKATGGSFDIGGRDTSPDDADGALDELDEQASGRVRVQTNSRYWSDRMGGNHESPQSLSYGEVSEVAGDHAATPAEVATRGTGDTAAGPADYYRMLTLAETNVNHFFPLNQAEYLNHHQKARAAAARGDRKTALLEEGFAAHFLQDCFAAGHMAPRALDQVGTSGMDVSALGLNRSKKWHDLLNKQRSGLPTTEGRFRGDDTMNAADLEHISSVTAVSLKQILDTLEGRQPAATRIPLPRPMVGEILNTRDYGPLWRGMMSDYEADLRAAPSNGRPARVTDGGTRYDLHDTASEIREHLYGGATTDIMRVTGAVWSASTLVFQVLVNEVQAQEGTTVWVSLYRRDSGYDRHESGNDAGTIDSRNAQVGGYAIVNDEDPRVAGPLPIRVREGGLGSVTAPPNPPNLIYAAFYADETGRVPVGRSKVQSQDTGALNMPLSVTGFDWSGATLSFRVARGAQAVDRQQLYVRWYDLDSGQDYDARGFREQTIYDTDPPVGETVSVRVTRGRGVVTATGAANDPGDTYGVVYLDPQATIPLGRSPTQP